MSDPWTTSGAAENRSRSTREHVPDRCNHGDVELCHGSASVPHVDNGGVAGVGASLGSGVAGVGAALGETPVDGKDSKNYVGHHCKRRPSHPSWQARTLSNFPPPGFRLKRLQPRPPRRFASGSSRGAVMATLKTVAMSGWLRFWNAVARHRFGIFLLVRWPDSVTEASRPEPKLQNAKAVSRHPLGRTALPKGRVSIRPSSSAKWRPHRPATVPSLSGTWHICRMPLTSGAVGWVWRFDAPRCGGVRLRWGRRSADPSHTSACCCR